MGTVSKGSSMAGKRRVFKDGKAVAHPWAIIAVGRKEGGFFLARAMGVGIPVWMSFQVVGQR
jgi:hypothetical protein